MRTLQVAGLALGLVGASWAQLSVGTGGASFSAGEQVIFASQGGTDSKDVGIGLTVDGPQASFHPEFPPTRCFGVQQQVERALAQDLRARRAPRPAQLDWDVLKALVDAGRLKQMPRDPEQDGWYSWWSYKLDERGRVRCDEHGSYRDPPAEGGEASAP